ncbi:hypothetical protein BDV93DRAFT_572093 [Ceratobasidium sp. AG-I]|nr:hypothetical protein BDV93DRAFT_572093 [Ceratobasidium sp. AG-I]
MSVTEFCVRACKDAPNAAKICNHIYGVTGCEWNIPGNYAQGVFENCVGDSAQAMWMYGSLTFHQGDPATPAAHPAPGSSSCKVVSTIGNAPATTSAVTSVVGSGSTAASSAAAATSTAANGAMSSNGPRFQLWNYCVRGCVCGGAVIWSVCFSFETFDTSFGRLSRT